MIKLAFPPNAFLESARHYFLWGVVRLGLVLSWRGWTSGAESCTAAVSTQLLIFALFPPIKWSHPAAAAVGNL